MAKKQKSSLTAKCVWTGHKAGFKGRPRAARWCTFKRIRESLSAHSPCPKVRFLNREKKEAGSLTGEEPGVITLPQLQNIWNNALLFSMECFSELVPSADGSYRISRSTEELWGSVRPHGFLYCTTKRQPDLSGVGSRKHDRHCAAIAVNPLFLLWNDSNQ